MRSVSDLTLVRKCNSKLSHGKSKNGKQHFVKDIDRDDKNDCESSAETLSTEKLPIDDEDDDFKAKRKTSSKSRSSWYNKIRQKFWMRSTE